MNAQQTVKEICQQIEARRSEAKAQNKFIPGEDLVKMVCDVLNIPSQTVTSTKTNTYGVKTTYHHIPITAEDGTKSGIVIDENGGHQPQETLPEKLKQDLGLYNKNLH